jgi:hypothetical protein
MTRLTKDDKTDLIVLVAIVVGAYFVLWLFMR